MQMRGLLILGVAFLVAADTPKPRATGALKGDSERLQGVWNMVRLEAGGKVAAEQEIKNAGVPQGILIKENMIKNLLEDPEGPLNCPFKLDTTTKPRRITLTGEGPNGLLTWYGIYSLQNDELRICLNEDGESSERPPEFATNKESPFILMMLKQAKR